MAVNQNAPIKILSAATTVAAGTGFKCTKLFKTFQAVLTGTGAVSATIRIEVSLDGGTTWSLLQTITITSAASPQQGVAYDSNPAALVRANVTAITGTAATLDVWMKSSRTDGDIG